MSNNTKSVVPSASFSLIGYKFDQVSLDFAGLNQSSEFGIDIIPSGVFDEKEGVFYLTFEFMLLDFTQKPSTIMRVLCNASFEFNGVHKLADIPEYFYVNSIAILFPYLRAFVSTVTLQANIAPFIIPTLNLGGLKEELVRKTTVKNEQ